MSNTTAGRIRLLRFVGKVQFTLVLLLGGALIMTVGTVLESRESRELAWSSIYGTLWFDGFLFLIGVNLSVAVINRIPIRRHQWPFVLTHFAIVLLLAGAWMSATFGYEGRMVIYEGREESQLLLDESEIRTRWHGSAGAATAAVDAAFVLASGRDATGRLLQEETQDRPGLRVAEYLSDGGVTVGLQEGGPGGVPGIEFRVSNTEGEVHDWLLAGDPRFARKDLGPLEVEFRVVGSEQVREESEPIEAPANAAVLVSVDPEGLPTRIAVPARVGQEVPCGRGVVARVQRYLLRARMVEGEFVDVASAPINPAAVVEIQLGAHSEVHTVFANFPDFDSVQGRDAERPLVAGVRLDGAGGTIKPRIAVLLGPDERLQLRLTSPLIGSQTVPLQVGRSVALDALGLDFELKRSLKSVRPELRVEASPDAGPTGRAYIRLDASWKGERRSLWLAHGGTTSDWAPEVGGRLEASFGPQTRPLPFVVALEEFELLRHPGSGRPAEYRSVVEVDPAASDLPTRKAVISMNRPLDVAGFRLFQSSYQLGREGGPDATVLSVSRDPGVPLVYVSFVLIIVGIAWGLLGVAPKSERVTRGPAPDRSPQREPGALSVPRGRPASGARTSRAVLPVLAALALLGAATPARAAGDESPGTRMPVEETRGWAILADGRVKPLLTYANETAVALTGRESFDGLSSLEILWGYVFAPRDFAERAYVRVDSPELKASLGLAAEARRFPFQTLMSHSSFRELVESALEQQRNDAELSLLERGALDVYAKLERVAGLMSTEALTVVPIVDADGGWRSPATLASSAQPEHQAVHAGFARLAAAYTAGDAEAFRDEARGMEPALRSLDPAVYPSSAKLERELFYEDLNAFGKAWKLYLAGFLVLLLGVSERRWVYVAGMLLMVAGFFAHSAGIGLRWAIAGRAPVSDMYESLVFMGWGAIALGLVPALIYRARLLAPAAGVMGFLCLAFAEGLPIEAAINPLVPVLAHTWWLSIHVMTIMLSYSALALTMVLGHVLLFVELFRRSEVTLLRTLFRLLNRTLEVGVLFLAAGISFGAIWANESWGRYWGWDPKETWSLITFFVYLAIIHARIAGWLGHFWMAACAVLGFLAVVMTYYGVNFILATGMHAYGFSEGGQLYAALYAGIEIAIVVAAYLRYSSLRRGVSSATTEPLTGT